MEIPILTDQQCRMFLKDAHEFGYSSLTFTEVRELANDIAKGKSVDCDVVGVMLKNQITEAMNMIEDRLK